MTSTTHSAATPEHAEFSRNHWKSMVNRRAMSIVRGIDKEEKLESLTRSIKGICSTKGDEVEAECLNVATVAAWMSDKSTLVPANRALHDALMEALALPTQETLAAKKPIDKRTNWQKRFSPAPKLDPVRARLANERTTLEREWEECFDHACKQFIAHDETQGAGEGAGSRSGSRSKHDLPQRNDGNYDSRFLPERTGDIATTHNIHEYLFLLRRKLDYSHEEMAEMLGISPTTYADWECGSAIPARESLQALKNKLNGDYEHLVNVLIDNRLSVMRGVLAEHTDSWGVENEHYKRVAAGILASMPRRYWHEVLDQVHNPHVYKTKQHQQKPDWAKHVVKAKTQGEYLQATRNYLALSTERLGEIIDVNGTTISNLEAGETSLGSDTAKRCIAYFATRQQQETDAQIANGIPEAKRDAPFFRADILARLPQHHRASEVHGPHVKKAIITKTAAGRGDGKC